MKIVAVICGNIRDIIDFKLTLTRLLELKNEHRIDHIIFSTWENELDAHPELKENMRLANIDVVETPPLHERYTKIESNSVNYWRQARQIQSALDAIEGDCFILKTRTDRCLNFLNQIDWDNLTTQFKPKLVNEIQYQKIQEYYALPLQAGIIQSGKNQLEISLQTEVGELDQGYLSLAASL